MPLFQYQGLTEPLLPIAEAPVPELAWLPVDARPSPVIRIQHSEAVYPILFVPSITEVRVSQAPIELATAYAFPLTRVSQAPIELLTQYAASIRQVRVSQMVIEIVYPFGCFEFRPGPPPACPVVLEPGPNAAVCADDAPPFFPVE